METETILRTRKLAIRFVRILLEKMHVSYQLLPDHVRDIIPDMPTTLRLSLANILHMEDATETTTDLNQMMNVRPFVPRTILTLPHTWSINAVYQLNPALVWVISQGRRLLCL